MAIDPQLLERTEKPTPRPALAWNQFTSNQSIRAIVALILVIALVYQLIQGANTSEALLALISALIGYYFGENAPTPPRNNP